MPNPECICPNGDTWACIDGTVYGPCTADNCGGVCESDGLCECKAHEAGGHGSPLDRDPAGPAHPKVEEPQ